MKEQSYAPRPGTKVALAVSAMLGGPMTIQDLGKAMNCPPKDVNAMLFVALKNGYMVRVKDETGLLHYALGSMPIDERFTKIGETDKAEEPAKARQNWNQGKFPSNPFPVSGEFVPSTPPKQIVKVIAHGGGPNGAGKSAGQEPIVGAGGGSTTPVAAPQPDIKVLTTYPAGGGGKSEPATISASPSQPTIANPPMCGFIAGWFSNGKLLINADGESITLSEDYTARLRTFLKTIPEAA